MSTSYDAWTRGKIIRGHAAAARPAFLDTELGRAPTLTLISSPAEPEVQQQVDEGLTAVEAAGYEQGYVHGYDEGKAVGYADGYQAGNDRAAADALAAATDRENRLGEALMALATAARECDARQRAAIDDIEQSVVEAVFDLAETLLGREMSRTRTPGRDALRRALSLADSHGPAVARLNPDDLETIGDYADLAPGRAIELVADPAIEPGGCILEAGSTRVDAQLGPALRRAKQALLS
jgi:flagellar assembly protein FliH